MKIEDIETAALKLAPKVRAKLARTLLQSLESLSEAEIEQLWVEEAMRREAEITTGKVKLIPAAKAFQHARSRLK